MNKAISILALLALCACACSAGNTGSDKGLDRRAPAGPRLTISGKTFSGPQDLSRLLEADKKGQRPAVVEFDRCTFQGKVTFAPLAQTFYAFGSGLKFTDCSFEDEVDARQVQFLGAFSMAKCRFKKPVNFQSATFLGTAGMRECSFDGDAAFQNAFFHREANFMDSHFFAYPLFQEARFLSKALFGNAIFHKNADFTLVRFMDAAQFDYAKFMGRADFSGSRLEGKLGLNQVQAQQILLRNVVALAPVSMAKQTLKDSTQTEGAYFLQGPPQK